MYERGAEELDSARTRLFETVSSQVDWKPEEDDKHALSPQQTHGNSEQSLPLQELVVGACVHPKAHLDALYVFNLRKHQEMGMILI